MLLDSITAKTKAIYSLRKVRPAYAGAAIRVRRSTDNAEMDIGFDAAGNINAATATAFAGAAATLNVVTWYDQSGNNRHANTIAGSATFATLQLTGLNGKPEIKFGSTNNSIYTALRTAANFTLTAPKIFTVCRTTETGQGFVFDFGYTNGGGQKYALVQYPDRFYAYLNFGVTFPVAAVPRLCQISMQFNSLTDRLYLNGEYVAHAGNTYESGDTSYGFVEGLANTDLTIGNLGIDNAASNFVGGISEIIVLDGDLSEDEQINIERSQAEYFIENLTIAPASLYPVSRYARYSKNLTASGGAGAYKFSLAGGNLPDGIELAPDGKISGDTTAPVASQIVVVGDSLTHGLFATDNLTDSPPALIKNAMPSVWRTINLGISGKRLNEWLADYDSMVAPLYNPAFQKNILVIAAGTNDVYLGTNVESLSATAQAIVNKAKATGWSVVFCDIAPAYQWILTPDFGAIVTPYNNFVANNLANTDAKVRFADSARLANPNPTTNPVYYYDALHLRSPGYAERANLTIAKINTITRNDGSGRQSASYRFTARAQDAGGKYGKRVYDLAVLPPSSNPPQRVDSIRVPNQHQFTGEFCLLRIYADVDFFNFDGDFIAEGDVSSRQSFYREIFCPIDGTEIIIPTAFLDATTVSSDPYATYSAFLCSASGSNRRNFLQNFRVPANAAGHSTWAQIAEFSRN